MPVYNITERKPAVLYWEFEVYAENKEEALRMVMDGEVDPINHDQEETLDLSEYDIEEAD